MAWKKETAQGQGNCGEQGVKAVPQVISPFHTLATDQDNLWAWDRRQQMETDCSAQAGDTEQRNNPAEGL